MLNNIAALISTSGGSATAFESIATTAGTGSSGTITFSSIPSTYKHLQLRAISKDTGTVNTQYMIRLQFNSDTGTNYAYHALLGDGTTATAYNGTSATYARLNAVVTDSGTNGGSNTMGASIIDIIDYASTSKYKTVRSLAGEEVNSSGNGRIGLFSGVWLSTSAITSISIIDSGNNWTTNTSFALYGIKG